LKREERLEVFCRAYARTYNQTEAAVAAGYGVGKDGQVNRRSAAVAAVKLMKDEWVQNRIDELMTSAANEVGATPMFIAEQLKEVVDRCMTETPVRIWDGEARQWIDTGEKTFNASGAVKALNVLADIQGLKKQTADVNLGGIEIRMGGFDERYAK